MPQEIPPQSSAAPRRRSLKRVGCVGVLLLVVTILIAAVGIGRSLWQSEPKYWVLNQWFLEQTPQPELAGMADRVFNRALSELSGSSGYKPVEQSGDHPSSDDAPRVRTIRVDFNEANAWLDQKLGDWMLNQGRTMPPGVSTPMIASHGDQLAIAFRYESEEIAKVFSVFLSLKFVEDEQATLQIEGVRGGRLPIPVDMVIDQLPSAEGDDYNASPGPPGLLGMLLEGRPFDPILPIDGTRQARIIGLSVDDTGLMLTLEAEPSRSKDKDGR